ncbi:MAG TPA: helical backbone metal receptor [Fimbriimonadaceae bacterium]|nr:helical backbone metal receptor [Fimbriimonadaceae bacterium]
MNWRALLASVLLLAIVGGCNQSDVGYGGKKRPKGYANVVSLSPSTTEYVIGLGSGNLLVGRTAASDRPPQIKTVPIVVVDQRPDPEKILAQNPDLIVYDKALYSDDEIAKIKALGIETMEYDPRTVEDYADFGYRLAAKLADETTFAEHIDAVYREVADARATPTTDPKTTILLGDGNGNYLVMGVDGFHANLFKICGGVPVGVPGPRFAPINIEKLIDLNPEVVYAGDEEALKILKDPRLQGIKAVKEHHVYPYDERTLLRMSMALNKIIKDFSHDIATLPTYDPGAKK